MPLGGVGPRLLLRRLRESMAEADGSQSRLDQVVRLIAQNMVAEVCSIYLMQPGDELELFATEGLKPSAVHKTRLKVGTGLVGDIAAHARPLNLSDAQSHPNFAYRPETGEEIYKSLMGVPILRSGRVVGVLVVQNRTMRHYSEEEVETLETIAMVLAELAAAADMIAPEAAEKDNGVRPPHYINGNALSDGIALGHAVLHEPRVHVSRLIAEDVEVESERLRAAIIDRQIADDI